jgi:NADH-quinone oxidoreductase subunit A
MHPMFAALPLTAVSGAANPAPDWAPIVLLLLIAIGFAVVNIVASIILGPSRTGPGKEETYESGMVPIGDTRKRFNVRFYIVAMIFLVIDVEIVFFYPFATIFAPYVWRDAHRAAAEPSHSLAMLVAIILFVALLLLAYIYAWGKGVFKWD